MTDEKSKTPKADQLRAMREENFARSQALADAKHREKLEAEVKAKISIKPRKQPYKRKQVKARGK